MTALKRIVPPPFEPLTLAEIKAHLRVTHDDEDDRILRCWRAARDYAEGPEGFLGRALIDQTWDLWLDKFPANEIKIPLPPLIEVASVNYVASDGFEQVLPDDQYTVDAVSDYGWVLPNGIWPTPMDSINTVRIRFRAGYIDASFSPPVGEIPENILQGLLIYTGTMFENRESVVTGHITAEIPWSAEQLLRRHRIDISMA